MKSPFPGMDPYLESHWGDLHTTLMVYARNQLNAQLPDDLQARVEESLAVMEDDEVARCIRTLAWSRNPARRWPLHPRGGGHDAGRSQTLRRQAHG